MTEGKVEFKKIYEHDIDLLIMEEFLSDQMFAWIFLEKTGLGRDYTIEKAVHSYSDEDGESDLTFILRYPTGRTAVMIEDKIDAPTMDRQSERYEKRGSKGKERGEYNSYTVLLVSPLAYQHEHENDPNANYRYKVSYEELIEYLSQKGDIRSAYKAEMLRFAVAEKKVGYQVREVKAVTEFWEKLRAYCKQNYPKLTMVGVSAPKGANASWPEFRTSLGKLKVIYKSDRGCVDFEFPRYGNRIGDLKILIGNKLSGGMKIEKTGNSASVRIYDDRWIIPFVECFDEKIVEVTEVLAAVEVLCELASELNYADLY